MKEGKKIFQKLELRKSTTMFDSYFFLIINVSKISILNLDNKKEKEGHSFAPLFFIRLWRYIIS